MEKEEFISLLQKAEKDENGNLYILGEYNNKIYFGTITTICEDIMENTPYPKQHEIYDRHFWNDDTLKCKVIYEVGD